MATNNKILAVRRSSIEMVESGHFLTEASEIGIAPGGPLPRMIAVPSRNGGEVLFRFAEAVGDEGWIYMQHLPYGNAMLQVMND